MRVGTDKKSVEREKLNATRLQADVFTVKYTQYQTSRLDTTTLKKELPDIAARYTKTTEARRFQVA